MADSNILRLRIDSKEYDSKLKSATDALSRYMDALKKGTSNLGSSRADLLKYVQAMGTMETKSTTVKGKIAELSKAYLELQSRYNSLSDAAKRSDVGQAMAHSLDQLRERTLQAKKELNDLGEQIGNLRQGTKAAGGMGIESLVGGLNNINSVVTGGMAGVQGLLGKAGPWGAAAAGVMTLGGAFASMGKEAVNAQRNIENLQLNIGTLLGDADKGKELVAELQKYGEATPYDTEGLASAAQTMLAYGVSAQQIMPLMKQLGDVAQGDTEHLQGLALAFGQMTAVGTVQKQDLNQMANAGLGFNQIAKSMGVSVAEFLDMVSKKKVHVSDIAKALQDATSAGGLFYHSALNASKGLEGTFSNFEESLTSTKAKFGAMIEPAVIEVVKALGNSIERLTANLGGSTEATKVFTSVGKGLGEVVKGAAAIFGSAVDTISTFGSIVKEIGGIASSVAGPLVTLTSHVMGLQDAFNSGSSNPLVKAIKELFNPLSTINTLLKTTLSLIRKAKQAITGEKADNSHPGWTDKQVKASQNAAVMQGRAKFSKDKNGRTIFTDNEGNQRGHHRYFKGQGWKRLTYDVSNARWKYVADPDYGNNFHRGTTITEPAGAGGFGGGSGKGGKTGHTAKTTPTEEQVNDKKINELQDQYVKLKTAREAAAAAGKDDKTVAPLDAQLSAINEQIDKLQERNDTIKSYKAEAAMKPLKFDVSAIPKIDLQQVKKDVNPYQELTDNNISGLTSSLQEQLKNADIGSFFYQELTSKLNDINIFRKLIDQAEQNGIDLSGLDLKTLWDQIVNSSDADDAVNTLADKIKEAWKDKTGQDNLYFDSKQGKMVQGDDSGNESDSGDGKKGKTKISANDIKTGLDDATKTMGQINSGITSITGGLKQMGVEIPAWIEKAISIFQGITSILTGISTTIGVILTLQAAKSTPFIGWLLHNGGLIHAASGYAVPGSSYSGDNVPAMLNSGELVLNRAQQGNLAAQLDGQAGFRNMSLSTTLKGEDIVLSANTHMRRTQGSELATSNITLW